MPVKKHKPLGSPGEGTLARLLWDTLMTNKGREVDLFEAFEKDGRGVADRKSGISTTLRTLENNYDMEIVCVRPKVYILKGIWDGKDWIEFDGKELVT